MSICFFSTDASISIIVIIGVEWFGSVMLRVRSNTFVDLNMFHMFFLKALTFVKIIKSSRIFNMLLDIFKILFAPCKVLRMTHETF